MYNLYTKNKQAKTSNRSLPLPLLLTLLLSLASFGARAVEIDGINYTLNASKQTATVARYNYNEDILTIPASVEYEGTTYSVTDIGNSAFAGCTDLTSIEIPNSVNYIADYAFYGCTDLTDIEMPNSVTYMGEYNQEIKGETNVEIIPVSA